MIVKWVICTLAVIVLVGMYKEYRKSNAHKPAPDIVIEDFYNALLIRGAVGFTIGLLLGAFLVSVLGQC